MNCLYLHFYPFVHVHGWDLQEKLEPGALSSQALAKL